MFKSAMTKIFKILFVVFSVSLLGALALFTTALVIHTAGTGSIVLIVPAFVICAYLLIWPLAEIAVRIFP